MKALEDRGAVVRRVDTETYPYDCPGTFEIDWRGVRSTWSDRIGSVWYRRVRSPSAPTEMPPDVHEYCVQEAKAFVVGSVLASGLPVMSAPERVWAAENKLLQLRLARECGFDVPETVVTNDAGKIRRFFEGCRGRMVVKPLRSGYVEIRGEPRAVFTSQVRQEDLNHLDDAMPSPAIYQVLVEKACDVRVTYIAGETFAAEIDSQSDPEASVDWRRTANPDLPHRPTELPRELGERVSQLMQRLGLKFGALDFIRTRDGRFVFLEVNPNGQWLWLEDRLEFPISRRIADWLVVRAGET